VAPDTIRHGFLLVGGLLMVVGAVLLFPLTPDPFLQGMLVMAALAGLAVAYEPFRREEVA